MGRCRFWYLLLVLLLGRPASGLPGGAPTAACSSLRPQHGSHRPQSGPAPYRLSSSSLSGGSGRRTVQLHADTVFRGLLLVARSASNRSGPALGRFQPAAGFSLLDCGGRSQNALTHASAATKQGLQVEWEPDGAVGDVVFTATVLQEYRMWWEDISTEVATVSTGTAGMLASLQMPTGVQDTYSGCFSQYGCFGVPANCEPAKNCEVLFTYITTEDGIKMGLMSKQDGRYAAVGFSDDDTMGDDGVIFCTNTADSQPVVYYGYNNGKSSTYKSGQNPSTVTNLEVWEDDGHFMCSFTQELNLVIPDEKSFNLIEKHHLLVATGILGSASQPEYHHSEKVVSSEAVDLTEFSALTSAGVPPLVKAHGAFMLIAWMGTAGIGILSAQYFKMTWVGKKLLGTDIWFTIHRSMMVLTAVCTWLGFALIVIHLKKLEFGHNHNIIGFTVCLISVLQVLGALARPSPTARLRPLFNWGHRTGGAVAYVLALAALFLAQQLPQLDLPRYWLWLLTAFIALDVVVSLVFMGIDHCVFSPQVQPSPGSTGKVEAAGSSHRKILLAIYVFFSVGFVVTMVTVLVLSDAGK